MRLSLRDATFQEIANDLPYRGRCAFCGGIDARHRLIDAIAERLHFGETALEIALDYGLSIWAVNAIALLESLG